MRKLNIEEIEELEDIEIELDKEIKESNNKFDDLYIEISNSEKLILDKKENSTKYIIDLCLDGFICKNPIIKDLYKDKEFSKNELIKFIHNFKNIRNNSLKNKFLNKEELINKEGKTFFIKGIDLEGLSTLDDSSSYELEKHLSAKLIIYIESNSKNLYRIELFESFGMCGSGWCRATWGNMDIYRIDKIPYKIFFTPKETLKINIKEKEDVDFYFDVLKKDKLIGDISISYYGLDSYYPSGYINDSFDFRMYYSIESNGKEYFEYDEKELKEFLNLEERIELGDNYV